MHAAESIPIPQGAVATRMKNVDQSQGIELPPELGDCLLRMGRNVQDAEEITTRSTSSEREAFRLVLDDGSFVKARWLLGEAHASRWNRLRNAVGDPLFLTATLHREGRFVLEEWIEGEPLPMLDVPAALLGQAGELLARMHLMDVPGRGTVEAADEVRRMDKLIDSLVSHGAFAESAAGGLRARLWESAPDHTVNGLAHFDFCGENLVMHPSRGLVSIDNEWMCLGSLEYDVARALYRWDLTGVARETFLGSYRAAGGAAAVDALDWWFFANSIHASEIRVRRAWPDAAATVAGLLASCPPQNKKLNTNPC